MRRVFILKASEGRTAPDFSLKSLAGAAGRMDLICRCVIAALYTPNGLDRSAEIALVLEGPPDPPLTVTFAGGEVQRAPVGEVEAAEMIVQAMQGKVLPGVKAERMGFEAAVARYRDLGFALYYLHEEGEPSKEVCFAVKSALVLGDQKGLDPASERFLDRMKAARVSLGPISYLASQCINIASGELRNAK